jgi:hypothetical protein
MTKECARLGSFEWLLSAAIALVGSIVLFDASAGINWLIWVALAVLVTLASRRFGDFALTRPPIFLGLAAIIAAGADARTTDTGAHVGIFWLTAVLLAAFLYCIARETWADVRLVELVVSPFVSLARVVTSAIREIGLALRAATDGPSRTIVRRTLLVAPVVILLLILFGGADPIIHSTIQDIEEWFPTITIGARLVFFGFLLLVMLGACSRLPDLKFGIPPRELRLSIAPRPMDGMILVGSTLATLVAFLILQTIYIFVQLPSQIGNGVTYAEYARRGFGQLCVVVTIVAAVILVAEKFRDPAAASQSRTLRRLEFATFAAAGLILLSALRRVILYENAYGYTIARIHATAYIVFMSGFLVFLALELRAGGITGALGRRSSALALVVMLVILYWNDQAWAMNRNIDRIHTTGKFDVSYAASLSADAVPTLIQRKNELPPAAWGALKEAAACKDFHVSLKWYEWNSAMSAALSAMKGAHQFMPLACRPLSTTRARGDKPAS